MGFIIALVVAYLLGSLSSSSLLVKYAGMPDPRQSGSGNPGATNVLRSGNKKQALFVLLGDMAKGFLAVIIALVLGVRGGALGIIAIAATAGHIFPVFEGFKGGKGVATALGTLIVTSFPSAILSVIVWAAVAFFTRFVSLASMVALVAAVIFTAITGAPGGITLFYLILAALVIWRHKDNIERLRKGNESKLDLSLIMGKKGNAKPSSSAAPSSPASEKPAEPAPSTEEKESDENQG